MASQRAASPAIRHIVIPPESNRAVTSNPARPPSMKCSALSSCQILTLASLVPLASASLTHAAEPARPPANAAASAGLVNDLLRSEIPGASKFDIGGQFRLRYEVRENGGLVANRDFLEGTDNSNDYFLFRTKAHLG